MSRKSNKQEEAVVETTELVVPMDVVEPTVEAVEPTTDVVEVVEPTTDVVEPAVEHDYEKENKVLLLESEIVKLQDRIKEIRKELKGLESKTKREGPTKMQLAVEYVENNRGLARKDYVDAFVKQLGLTAPGAKTYIQLILAKSKKEEAEKGQTT
jgi:hypothetical protein